MNAPTVERQAPAGPGPLFSANAAYGHDVCTSSVLNTLNDLVFYLDRLGVDRSLVWRREAANYCATWGNRALLDDLDRHAAWADRLIPAFVITPSMLYEEGAMAFLRESVASGRVRALRVMPRRCGHAPVLIEPVLAAVEACAPLVLWDMQEPHGPTDAQQIGELAVRHPRIPIVCTQFMYPQFLPVLDLMRRHHNVMADISWMHVRRGIETLVRQGGAERVLFGLGAEQQHGAAIAALAHADVTEDQRRCIASANLERLLRIPPSTVRHTPAPERRPWWDALRRGGPVRGCDIVDAHTHLGPMARGWVLPELGMKDLLAAHVAQMDRLGIGQSLVMSEEALFGDPVHANPDIIRIVGPHRDRLRGMFVFHPRRADALAPLMSPLFETGFFVGFKSLYGPYWNVAVDDPGFRPMWEYADAHRLPILLHTWDDLAGLDRLLQLHPNAVLLMGHAGGGDRGRCQAIHLAQTHENAYLEWCGSFTSGISWAETMAAVGPHRVVFGSDTLPHDGAWELGRLLSQPIPEEELRPMLGGNLRAILSRRC